MLARLLAFVRKRDLDRELDEELAIHIEMATEDNVQRGMPLKEARRQALISFGALEAAKELHRDARGLPMVETLLQDLRFCLRTLRLNPTFTLFAVLSIALGVGASSTVFSVVNALLVRPLPFEQPERLLWIENDEGPTQSEKTVQVSHLLELQQGASLLADVAGYHGFERRGERRLISPGEPERLTGIRVTQGFFSTLGVRPQLGRLFTDEESQWNGPPAVLMSHHLWQRRFGGDPDLVGTSVTINDEAVAVVGVLPASFDFASFFQPGSPIDLFLPYSLGLENNRRGNTLFLIARLADGATLEAATTQVETFATRSDSATRVNAFSPVVMSLRERVSGEYRRAMTVLAGAVGLMMLIVCANLSNLLLTRATAREREIAVRAALGASRGRLVRQMLTECLVLSSSGAAAGLVLAWAGTRLLASMDSLQIPLRELIHLDAATVAFAAAIAVGTGVAFGLIPALRGSDLATGGALKDGERGSSGGRGQGWTRGLLVVSELALTCVLLVGAGLLSRSFVRILDVDLGFQPLGTVALRVDPGSPFSMRGADLQYLDEALLNVRATAGVESAGLVDALPLRRNRQWYVGERGRTYGRGEKPAAYVHIVSEGYLRAMGIPLVDGRDFVTADDRSALPVILVNETLADILTPGDSPIGRVLEVDKDRRIIGVVADVRHLGVEQRSGAEIYLTVRQTGDYSAMNLVVRGARSPADLLAVARESIRDLNPDLPLTEAVVVQEVVEESISPRRFVVTLLGGFAGFALALSALGIYGVISYSVSRQRREIGIRVALGATPSDLQRGIVAETLKLTLVGIAIGAAGAWAGAQLLASLLYDIEPTDPLTFAGTMIVMVSVALLAAFVPARRATRVDVVSTLLAE